MGDFHLKIEESVFPLLNNSDKTEIIGTAFCVLPGGYCLTCDHVIRSQFNRYQKILGQWEGKIIEFDYINEYSNQLGDIAVLLPQVPHRVPFVPLGEYKLNSMVHAFGFRSDFLDGYRVKGEISRGQVFRMKGPVLNYLTDLPAGSELTGMSGSPVYDVENECVIGIFYGEEKDGPSVSYVHPIYKVFETWPALIDENLNEFSTSKVKVVIADDMQVVRLGLRQMIQEKEEILIVGEIADQTEIVSKTLSLKPDLLITDIHWDGDENFGLNAINQIAKSDPEIKILAISAYTQWLDKAIANGASCSLNKTFTDDKLIACISSLVK